MNEYGYGAFYGEVAWRKLKATHKDLDRLREDLGPAISLESLRAAQVLLAEVIASWEEVEHLMKLEAICG